MPKLLTEYRVFIGSPSGLAEERSIFRKTIDAFNRNEGSRFGVWFTAVGWEDTVGGIGRPQERINQDVSSCDFFVFLFWNRWGSPTGSKKESFRSGTEEEIAIAKRMLEDKSSGMRDIAILFKEVDSRQLSDPGEQLKQVLSFKKNLEIEKKYLYKSYGSLDEFSTVIRSHLALWLDWHLHLKILEENKSKKEVEYSQDVGNLQEADEERSNNGGSDDEVLNEYRSSDSELKKASVFISYARKDNEVSEDRLGWLDLLLEHLSPLSDQIDIWSDKRIKSGDDWHAEVQNALLSARVAVLLVSPAFLSSSYIRSSELPALLQDAIEQKGLVVIPVIVRPCLFKEIKFKYPNPESGPREIALSSFQSANDPRNALNGLTENERDLVCLSVSQRIYELAVG